MSREYLLRLPWPPKQLAPNSRVHYMQKAARASKYRTDSRLIAQAGGCCALDCDRLTVEITFHPPDKRRRDTDNMLASIKSGLDGIADATGVDDERWHYGIARGDPVKGGAVLVHVLPSKSDT